MLVSTITVMVYYEPWPESLSSWLILAVGRILFFLISTRKYAQNRGEAEVFAGRGGH